MLPDNISQIFLHDITFSFHALKIEIDQLKIRKRISEQKNAMITINHITRGARNFPFVWNPCHFFRFFVLSDFVSLNESIRLQK